MNLERGAAECSACEGLVLRRRYDLLKANKYRGFFMEDVQKFVHQIFAALAAIHKARAVAAAGGRPRRGHCLYTELPTLRSIVTFKAFRIAGGHFKDFSGVSAGSKVLNSPVFPELVAARACAQPPSSVPRRSG